MKCNLHFVTPPETKYIGVCCCSLSVSKSPDCCYTLARSARGRRNNCARPGAACCSRGGLEASMTISYEKCSFDGWFAGLLWGVQRAGRMVGVGGGVSERVGCHKAPGAAAASSLRSTACATHEHCYSVTVTRQCQLTVQAQLAQPDTKATAAGRLLAKGNSSRDLQGTQLCWSRCRRCCYLHVYT